MTTIIIEQTSSQKWKATLPADKGRGAWSSPYGTTPRVVFDAVMDRLRELGVYEEDAAGSLNNLYVGRTTPQADAGDPPQEWDVTVNGRPLDLRLELRNHSPTGFCWGYNGSGPAQLALAILAHEFGDEYAQRHYQRFKDAVVARWPQDKGFVLTSNQIQAAIAA